MRCNYDARSSSATDYVPSFTPSPAEELAHNIAQALSGSDWKMDVFKTLIEASSEALRGFLSKLESAKESNLGSEESNEKLNWLINATRAAVECRKSK